MNTTPALTPKQVGEILQISPDQVIDLIRAGRLEGFSISIGKKRQVFRVNPEALEAFRNSPTEPVASSDFKVDRPNISAKRFIKL